MKQSCFLILLIFLICCQNNRDTARLRTNIKREDIKKDYSVKLYLPNRPYNVRLKYADSVYTVLQSLQNDSIVRKQLSDLCQIYLTLNAWYKLRACTQYAEKLAYDAKDTTSLAIADYYFGSFWMNLSTNDSAFYYLNKAIRIFKKNNDVKRLCPCYRALAELYYYTCDYQSSDKAAISLFKCAREMKDKWYLKSALNWFAINANEMGDYEKADEYHIKSSEFIEAGDDSGIVNLLYSKGYNYFKAGKNSIAIQNFEAALNASKKPSTNPINYASSLDYLAYVKFKQNDFKSLPEPYLKSELIRDSFNIDAGRNYNKLFLSEYYAAIGDSIKARDYAVMALKISESFKAPKDRLISLKHLVTVDTKNSPTYINQYIRLSDSLQLSEHKNRNKFARIAFETEEISNEKDKAVRYKWIVLALGSTLLLLTLLLFTIWLQKVKHKELQMIENRQKAEESLYQLMSEEQLKIDGVRQQEKKRIARELHDGIMNRLASTRLNLFILNKSQDRQTIDKCMGYIGNIKDIEEEMRRIADDLEDESFATPLSFSRLLESLFTGFRDASDIVLTTHIDSGFEWERVDRILRMNIYRILQETLYNSHKYSRAKRLTVTLSEKNGFIRILISDDGVGFDTNKIGNGIGLQNIYERVGSLGGEIKITSENHKGTNLEIWLPNNSIARA